MSKAAAQNATRMANTNVNGYFPCIEEYNRLAKLVVEQFGAEASQLFQPIDLKTIYPSNIPPIMWGNYAELATTRLTSLATYLQSKIGSPDRQILALLDLIKAMLRPSIYEEPKQEKDIQDTLEIIFRARGIDFRRGKISIEYSSKRFIPDFTFEPFNLALEVKFCDSVKKEKIIIDEMNADIPAYQTRYRWIIFLVYDLGFIRDEYLFKSSFERNSYVNIHIQKH
jgi:hypothetical protein